MEEKLNGNNWTIWREQMKHAFKMTGLAPYVNSTFPVPNEVNQPINFGNWEFNNNYACMLIIKNVNNSQFKHITKYTFALDMWKSLTWVHKTQGFETGLQFMQSFWSSSCSEDDDVEKHIDKVKEMGALKHA
jgi:gag-polypeptide of LTR copia-type